MENPVTALDHDRVIFALFGRGHECPDIVQAECLAHV